MHGDPKNLDPIQFQSSEKPKISITIHPNLVAIYEGRSKRKRTGSVEAADKHAL